RLMTSRHRATRVVSWRRNGARRYRRDRPQRARRIADRRAAAPRRHARARVNSPMGELRLASTAAGLAFLELPHSNGKGFTGWLRRWAPGARVEQGSAPNQRAPKEPLEDLRRN